MEQQVNAGDNVAIHYVGRLEDETVFDSTEGRDPFRFEAGSKEVLPVVSGGVIGMQVGEQRTLEVPPAEGYGEHDPALIIEIPTERLPDGTGVGDMLKDDGPAPRTWVVKSVADETSTLDGNHPLAGHTLRFDIEVVDIG
jgi:FKBP-type peptidyl-prolyl cis-trans isomerase 2